MSMTFPRLSLIAACGLLCAGCHSLRENCNEPQPYEAARTAPPLKIPEGVSPVNTKSSLAIPSVATERKKLGPKDACRDIPPAYYVEKATPSS